MIVSPFQVCYDSVTVRKSPEKFSSFSGLFLKYYKLYDIIEEKTENSNYGKKNQEFCF